MTPRARSAADLAPLPGPLQEREQMQRYNQRMVEQLKVRQQQEKARLPKIQRSEGKTRMAMYKKSLHISGAGSAAEQREKIKQVGPCVRERAQVSFTLQGWRT